MPKKVQKVFTEISITDAGARGVSIAKAPDGKVIMVDNAVPGDVCDIRIYKSKRGYHQGKAIHFHSLSARRTQPKCEHFGVCGGCKWQHMDYESQLYFKQKEVYNNLRRIGKVELPEETPALGSANPYFYRNKMEFSFSDSRWLTEAEIATDEAFTQNNALGFHIPGRWDKILDLKNCYLQPEPSNSIRNAVKAFAIENELDFFNARNQTGFLRTLMIRTTSTGEIMVLVQFFCEDKIKRESLLNFILEKFPEVTSLQYTINAKPNDTLYDQEVVCYHGKPVIEEEMEGLRFPIHAKSFYQTNSAQAYELYKIVREFAGLTGKELVYDLYTGIGTIAQFVAKNAKKVIGIESVPEATADAKRCAETNKIGNVSFYTGDMKTLLRADFVNQNGLPDVVITDPPRDGMHKDVVEQLLQMAPAKIVYVSCNSATQARDLNLMKENYRVAKVRPVDMFPQTFHVENVVLLEKI